MSRPRKESVNLSINLDKKVSDMLVAMSEETGLPKTAIIENGTKEYIQRYNETGQIKPFKNTT